MPERVGHRTADHTPPPHRSLGQRGLIRPKRVRDSLVDSVACLPLGWIRLLVEGLCNRQGAAQRGGGINA
jgi:hypothetical protein